MKTPDDIRRRLRDSLWEKRPRLIEHLLEPSRGIEYKLASITSTAVLKDIGEFRGFVDAWVEVSRQLPEVVRMETRPLRGLGEVDVPERAVFEDLDEIAAFLGGDAPARLQRIRRLLTPFAEIDERLYLAAARLLSSIEKLEDDRALRIAAVVSSLEAGMGSGRYLRELPLPEIDTKLIETHESLISHLIDGWRDSCVSHNGGLLNWLGCLAQDRDRILVRPLSERVQAALGGLPYFWVTSETLRSTPLPGHQVLVIENETTGRSCPDVEGTVCIAGAGNNLRWIGADWLASRRIGYWGDLDTWGLGMLASARSYAPHVESVLMDEATWRAHSSLVVDEPSPRSAPEQGLTMAEARLFGLLRTDDARTGRLEQERLDPDWCASRLASWARGGDRH